MTESHGPLAGEVFESPSLAGPFRLPDGRTALTYYFPKRGYRRRFDEDQLSQMMFDMKYCGKIEYAPFFADCIVEFVGACNARECMDIIVPCPTSKPRVKQPLNEMVSRIAGRLSKPYTHALVKHGGSQMGKGRAARLEEARKIEAVEGLNLSGMRVLLLDDVTTTGGTMLVSRQRLMDSGAKSVTCLSVCITYEGVDHPHCESRQELFLTKECIGEAIVAGESAKGLVYLDYFLNRGDLSAPDRVGLAVLAARHGRADLLEYLLTTTPPFDEGALQQVQAAALASRNPGVIRVLRARG